MMERWLELIRDLTDNDTLIIIGLIILAFTSTAPDTATAIVGGLLGYMKGRGDQL